MREEWLQPNPGIYTSSRSSQGLTSRKSMNLSMASRAMRLKDIKKVAPREISERRQVGDAEDMMHPRESSTGRGPGTPWWRNVTMEEGV